MLDTQFLILFRYLCAMKTSVTHKLDKCMKQWILFVVCCMQHGILLAQEVCITTFPSNITICPGDVVQLLALTTGANVHWYPSDGLSANNIFNPIATATQSVTYQVMADGCADTAYVTIMVDDNFAPQVPTSLGYCVGEPLGLNTEGGVFTEWHDEHLNCEYCEDPVFVSNEPDMIYDLSVTLYDNFGCPYEYPITIYPSTLCNVGQEVVTDVLWKATYEANTHTIVWNAPAGEGKVYLFDLLGRILASADLAEQQLSVANLPKGEYIMVANPQQTPPQRQNIIVF